ncbi:MAG: MerR family transcriptional regulator [Candidatus Kapabacteria bacterium]|nr:MerR family transcriptional regulator [Candidatus Kapabacteria bacterium]
MRNGIQKLYYSITETAKMIGEEQHVLRYWEREFPQLRPQKNRAGNRVYTQRDLAVLYVIKRLLRQERYTVAGAKELLRLHTVEELATHVAPMTEAAVQTMPTVAGNTGTELTSEAEAIKDELAAIADILRAAAARM